MTSSMDVAEKRQKLLGEWLAVMGNFIGYTKGEINAQIKKRLLVGLMLSYPDEYPELTRTYSQIQSFSHERADEAKEAISHHVNANDLTDEHFAEYMKDIEAFAGDMGIQLPHPSGLYAELVGLTHA